MENFKFFTEDDLSAEVDSLIKNPSLTEEVRNTGLMVLRYVGDLMKEGKTFVTNDKREILLWEREGELQ